MKLSRITLPGVSGLLFSIALLHGCGGSSPTATITTSGADIRGFVDKTLIVSSEGPTELRVTANALGDNTLSGLKISSTAIPGLNEETTIPLQKTATMRLDFTPVEGAKVTIAATVTKPDGKTHKNTNNYTVNKVTPYMSRDPRQILSIHKPSTPKSGRPAILFIHGNWDDYTYFYEQAKAAAGAGYFAATMDFRTFDSFAADASHMPDQIEDVRCAIQYLKANSAYLNINANNIGIVGYSIGATLGLLATYGNTSLIPNGSGYANRCAYAGENTDIKAIAALSAPADVLHLLGTARDTTTPLLTRHAFERFIGTAEDSSKFIRNHYDQYFSANPSASLSSWKSALKNAYPASTANGAIVQSADRLSPANVLANKPVPLYIMHGKTDLTFPCQHALWNVQAATQSDIYFYVFTASSNDHNWQGEGATPKTQARLRYTAFFNRYLANESVSIPTEPVTCNI